MRRTKIIATLGPATDDDAVLSEIIRVGVDVVRLNFSHGSADEHKARAEKVRAFAAQHNRQVAVMVDLQGPKIRVARFKAGSVELTSGQPFTLDHTLDKSSGDTHQVGLDYDALHTDVFPDDMLLLDDGRITLRVKEIAGTRIICEVVDGGVLSNNKGINKQGGGLSAPALTAKDKADLKVAKAIDAEYIAVSFVRHAQDILEARQCLSDCDFHSAGIVTKIERADALNHLDEIINASDVVMVARGDLGVEIGDAELPAAQKRIIGRARALDKAVVTATQMMESMIENALPTRAEVFDVANAVIDGTDCVMLSAETATGANPVKVVEAMVRVCLGAERERVTQVSGHRIECYFERTDEAIAMATMYAANHCDVRAIVALTESGSTPRWMSRIRSGIPIFALCRSKKFLRRMAMYRGVYPIFFDVTQMSAETVNQQAVRTLLQQQHVAPEDRVILTKGDLMGVDGGSNTMKILHVGAVA